MCEAHDSETEKAVAIKMMDLENQPKKELIISVRMSPLQCKLYRSYLNKHVGDMDNAEVGWWSGDGVHVHQWGLVTKMAAQYELY